MSLSATRWSLIQAAKSGDDEAIRALCLKYRPAMLSYLAKRGVRADTREDVAQEALVGLVRTALAQAESGRGRFRALVFAVARNQLHKHIERETAQKRGGGQVRALGEIDPAAGAEPDDDFDREWLAHMVQAALARLAREHANYFESLQRFVLDEQPQDQIARDLGISVGAVKKHVFRGKKKLTEYLKQEVWAYAGSPGEYELELRYLADLLGLEPQR